MPRNLDNSFCHLSLNSTDELSIKTPWSRGIIGIGVELTFSEGVIHKEKIAVVKIEMDIKFIKKSHGSCANSSDESIRKVS